MNHFSPILMITDAGQETFAEQVMCPLVQRVVAVARALNAPVHVAHLLFEADISHPFFSDESSVLTERSERTRAADEWLTRYTAPLAAAELSFEYKTYWVRSRDEFIRELTAHLGARWVMKKTQDLNGWLSLYPSADATLIPESRAPIWFVNTTRSISNMLVTVGGGHGEDIVTPLDYRVAAFAHDLAAILSTNVHIVHAYELPGSLANSSYLPEAEDNGADTLQAKHGRAVQALVDANHLGSHSIAMVEGLVTKVIEQSMMDVKADLVVIGAHERSFWERMWSHSTAEDALQVTSCDLVFVPDNKPFEGRGLDWVAAIQSPADVFSKPALLAARNDLPAGVRDRLLALWALDAQDSADTISRLRQSLLNDSQA